MRNSIQFANLAGVIVLGALSVFQWRADRSLNLSLIDAERARQQQVVKIQDLENKLRDVNDDLGQFKRSYSEEHGARIDVERKSLDAQLALARTQQERDQLKVALTNWEAAVTVRDNRLQEAGERIRDLGEKLNARVAQYNELATNYNAAVQRLAEAKKYIESHPAAKQ